MRRLSWIAIVILILTLPRSSWAQQKQQTPSPSQTPAKSARPQKVDRLAEAARKAREAQKNAPKPAVVYTNDNLPTAASAVSVVGPAEAAAKSGEKPAAGVQKSPAGAAAPSRESRGETYWRKKFSDARTKLSQDQAELAIMQRELSQLQLQYYPDPNKALAQGYSREDINKKQQQIAEKQKQIQQDQQAISDLEDALHKAGGDPAWAGQ